MQRVVLARSGVAVSRAVFGCARLGGTVGPFDRREALAILGRALDAGINTFDTADIYAQGNSERLLADAFRERRDKVVLATKGGYAFSTAASVLSKLKPLLRPLLKLRPGVAKMAQKARGSQLHQDFSRAHLTAALDASLRRLRTDYVDLYQLHSPSAEVLHEGSVFDTLSDLKRAGKIRAFGVSVLSPEDGADCFQSDAIQLEAHLLRPAALRSLVPAASERGIATFVRQPFGSGLLTRNPSTWTHDDFGRDAGALATARARMNRLAALGTPTDLALRYLVHHSACSAVIFATTSLAHLEANLASLAAPPFSAADLSQLEAIIY